MWAVVANLWMLCAYPLASGPCIPWNRPKTHLPSPTSSTLQRCGSSSATTWWHPTQASRVGGRKRGWFREWAKVKEYIIRQIGTIYHVQMCWWSRGAKDYAHLSVDTSWKTWKKGIMVARREELRKERPTHLVACAPWSRGLGHVHPIARTPRRVWAFEERDHAQLVARRSNNLCNESRSLLKGMVWWVCVGGGV